MLPIHDLETIRPGGDLILQVMNEPIGLLVSSSWLSASSPVFQTMLEGQFSEGRATRSTDSPQTIQLPDDSWSGMRDMCALLHLNMDFIREHDWVTTRLLDLAIVSDKYGVAKALQL